MSEELEYEHNNKEVLEKCCQVMNVKAVAVKEFKKTKRVTRLRIDELIEKRKLREAIELSF